MNDDGLRGRVFLVTGSGRGLGAALARAAGTEKARVVVNCRRDTKAAEAVAADVQKAGGEAIVVRSKRGQIKLKALVTKRIHALTIEGQEVHTVGLPLHWGFEGLTKPGYLVNTLTPFVADANIQTPEFKAFLVDVQKA